MQSICFSLLAQNEKQFSIFIPLGLILQRMTQTAFYRARRWLQTIREKCVLLICDTFCVFWFLSLEYVIFYCFSFRIPSQLKRVQPHLQRNPVK